ncbi:MAG: hypothetical protein K2J24_07320 [Muribaculaceae bacterium]|nr:hypothetical protein [Muribaculaceae bacterium]MDE7189772.1 hypothetical protein [Muribaculaceae bacterium]
MAVTTEEISGVYNANITVLDLGAFGNAGEDWTPVTFDQHEVTVTAEGNTLTFINFFPVENGNLTGTFDPENATILFQPQTVLGDYTFCGYPTGDWWMDNKLTEDPAPMTATVNKDAQIVFDMWSIVKGVDVVATNYTADILVPVNTDAGVSDVSFIPSDRVYVYTVTGLYVGSADTVRNALENLPAGLYIVNGKKILKK